MCDAQFEDAEATTSKAEAQKDPALAATASGSRLAELRAAQATAHADGPWQKVAEAEGAAAAAMAEAEAGVTRTIGEVQETLVSLEGKLKDAEGAEEHVLEVKYLLLLRFILGGLLCALVGTIMFVCGWTKSPFFFRFRRYWRRMSVLG